MANTLTYKQGQGTRDAAVGSLGGIVLTPHDSNNELFYFRAIYVGVGGNITVVCIDDSTLLFTAVPVGVTIPIHGKRINSTGTAAQQIVGLY